MNSKTVRLCKVCGDPFTSKSGIQKCCPGECMKENRKRATRKRSSKVWKSLRAVELKTKEIDQEFLVRGNISGTGSDGYQVTNGN